MSAHNTIPAGDFPRGFFLPDATVLCGPCATEHGHGAPPQDFGPVCEDDTLTDCEYCGRLIRARHDVGRLHNLHHRVFPFAGTMSSLGQMGGMTCALIVRHRDDQPEGYWMVTEDEEDRDCFVIGQYLGEAEEPKDYVDGLSAEQVIAHLIENGATLIENSPADY